MLNKWIGIGRLTKDVELSYVSAENTPKTTFTIAIDRRFAKNGETDFINCQAWGKNAENISKFFKKGNMINVVGSVRVESWDNDEGKKIYATKINVEEWNFCGSKNDKKDKKDEIVEVQDNEEDCPFF